MQRTLARLIDGNKRRAGAAQPRAQGDVPTAVENVK